MINKVHSDPSAVCSTINEKRIEKLTTRKGEPA